VVLCVCGDSNSLLLLFVGTFQTLHCWTFTVIFFFCE
jgi:hypothetical protein